MALGLDYWMVPQVTAQFSGMFEMNEDRAAAVTRLLRHVLIRRKLGHILQDHHSDL
jgi:hypothetical protein